MNDAELLRRVSSGDHDAFTVIVERYRNRVKTYIFRLIQSEDRAEDLTQDVFLRLYRHVIRHAAPPEEDDVAGRVLFRPPPEEGAVIAPLLFRFAKQVTIDDIRSESSRHRLQEEYATVRRAQPERADAVVDLEELQEELTAALAKLPPVYRKPALLYFRFELTQREIARLTRVPMRTVKSRLKRARELLTTHLGRYWKGEKA